MGVAHGLALNANMDLAPFGNINPYGFSGMSVTQARDLGINSSHAELEQQLAENLVALLRDCGYGRCAWSGT